MEEWKGNGVEFMYKCVINWVCLILFDCISVCLGVCVLILIGIFGNVE